MMGLAVDREHGIVRLDFGKPVAWVGLPVQQAKELGAALIEKANELEQTKA